MQKTTRLASLVHVPSILTIGFLAVVAPVLCLVTAAVGFSDWRRRSLDDAELLIDPKTGKRVELRSFSAMNT